MVASGLASGAAAKGVPAPVSSLKWSPCSDAKTLECTTLVVPVDRRRAGGPTMGIGITRVPASNPARRIGTLFVNPGGPGASGQTFARQIRRAISTDLSDRFDIIGWDPRGVGTSGPIRCLGSMSAYDRYYAADPVPDTPAEQQSLVSVTREFANGCSKRNTTDALRFAGTSEVVDDIDDIRRALGEETISFFGFSYGTLLAARYADRYPNRVRAFVLDGVLDPTADTSVRAEHQAAGFDQALAGFFATCSNASCDWVKSGEEPGTAFDRMARSIDASPLVVGSRRGKGSRLLGPGEFAAGVLASLYNRESGWPALRRALAGVAKGDGADLLTIFDSYADRSASGYGNIADANSAVNCVDVPSPKGISGFVALADRLAVKSPRFGRLAAYSSLVCGYWPVPSTGSLAPVRAAGSPTILLIGTTRDPATPYDWAQSVAKQLEHASLLTYDSDGHTAYLTGNTCVRRYVDRYLIDGTTPPDGTVCNRT